MSEVGRALLARAKNEATGEQKHPVVSVRLNAWPLPANHPAWSTCVLRTPGNCE